MAPPRDVIRPPAELVVVEEARPVGLLEPFGPGPRLRRVSGHQVGPARLFEFGLDPLVKRAGPLEGGQLVFVIEEGPPQPERAVRPAEPQQDPVLGDAAGVAADWAEAAALASATPAAPKAIPAAPRNAVRRVTSWRSLVFSMGHCSFEAAPHFARR